MTDLSRNAARLPILLLPLMLMLGACSQVPPRSSPASPATAPKPVQPRAPNAAPRAATATAPAAKPPQVAATGSAAAKPAAPSPSSSSRALPASGEPGKPATAASPPAGTTIATARTTSPTAAAPVSIAKPASTAAAAVVAPAPATTTSAAPAAVAASTSVQAAAAAAAPKPLPATTAPKRPPASAVTRYEGITEYERRTLAAMPLPKLPTLVSREAAAAAAEASAAAAAAAAAQAAEPATRVAVATAPEAGPDTGSALSTEIRSLLAKAGDRTGLGDPQLARIAELEAAAGRGEQQAALVGLLRINEEFDAAMNSHTVVAGESLWEIAARAEAYGNANLWPLIWRANPRSLPQPSQVRAGQKLRLPRYPSLTAVAEALDYARAHPLGGR